ncbi:unnamed protein product [Linum trigynum]|uniref:Uncharacterized protein n=1 Tax=Linum trigynum TaxID=586398 RepID=A0AAV2F9E7_9ROSI
MEKSEEERRGKSKYRGKSRGVEVQIRNQSTDKEARRPTVLRLRNQAVEYYCIALPEPLSQADLKRRLNRFSGNLITAHFEEQEEEEEEEEEEA